MTGRITAESGLTFQMRDFDGGKVDPSDEALVEAHRGNLESGRGVRWEQHRERMHGELEA